MKKICCIVIAFVSFIAVNAQNKLEKTGNVGIGTTEPVAKLEVKNSNNMSTRLNMNDKSSISFIPNNSNSWFHLSHGLNNDLHFSHGSFVGYKKIMTIKNIGNVGIGTESPLEILQIGDFRNTRNLKLSLPGVYNFEQVKLGQYGNGACGLEFVNHTNRSSSYGVRLYSNIDNGVRGLQIQTASSVDSYQKLKYTTKLAINTNGNVGIGTINPRAKLHVKGGFYIQGENWKSGWNYTNFNWVGHTLVMGSPRGNYAHNVIDFKPGGASQGELFSAFNMYHALNEDTHEKRISINSSKTSSTFFNAGNVGIGTTTPDAKLSVNGNIHTKEVKVDMAGWPDYVFTEDYNLPSLQEVERHINKKGHLADIPSAKEVAKKGVQLGEMNKKLLQKIEELTLYTIQQEKKLKSQESINLDLASRLERLEKLLKAKK